MYNLPQVKLSFVTDKGIKPQPRPKVSSSRVTFEILNSVYDRETIEHIESFYCLLLNRQNKVIGVHLVSVGGISGTVVDIRVVLQAAILSNASAIIVSHNHPSGNVTPSEQDILITQKIKEAAKVMDILLVDHMIISAEGIYYSFADEGLI